MPQGEEPVSCLLLLRCRRHLVPIAGDHIQFLGEALVGLPPHPAENIILQGGVLRAGVEQQATKEIVIDPIQFHLKRLKSSHSAKGILSKIPAISFVQRLKQQIDLQLPVPVLPPHADEDLPQQVLQDALRVHESPDRYEDRDFPAFANPAEDALEHVGLARSGLSEDQAGKGLCRVLSRHLQEQVNMVDDGTVEGVEVGVGVVPGIGGRGRGKGILRRQLAANHAVVQAIHVIVPILKPFSSTKPS